MYLIFFPELKVIFRNKVFYFFLFVLIGTIVIGKPIFKTFQEFTENPIDLFENIEDNSSEEIEFEDNFENQHFLKRKLDLTLIIFTTYNLFFFKESKLLTSFKTPLLQPPQS